MQGACVIVGASAAGVSAATALRHHGYDGQIHLVDASSHRPYERPPLSKTLHHPGPLQPIVTDQVYADLDIQLQLGAEVTRLETARRRVILGGSDTIAADAVLLATGGTPRRLGVPGENLDNVVTLRDAEDAARIAERFGQGGPVVIVGGGFIGLEIAAGARRLRLDVTVVEVERYPLLGVLGQAGAARMQELHENRGVHFRTGCRVDGFQGSRSVEAVRLSTGEYLPAATVIIGCGVIPNDRLAREAGIYCRDGIVIDSDGRTSHEWVWASGDVASMTNPYMIGRRRIEHWDVACRHGAVVGAKIAGAPAEYDAVPYFWSDQYESHLQMFGRPDPSDQQVLRTTVEGEGFVAFWLRDGYLAAVAGLDSPKDVLAARLLIEHRTPVDRSALSDRSIPIRDLPAAMPTN